MIAPTRKDSSVAAIFLIFTFISYSSENDSLVPVVGTRKGESSFNRRVLFSSVVFFRAVFEAKLLTMDTFTLEAFVEEPTLQAINLLKKSQLLEVASYYKVEVNSSQRKAKSNKY